MCSADVPSWLDSVDMEGQGTSQAQVGGEGVLRVSLQTSVVSLSICGSPCPGLPWAPFQQRLRSNEGPPLSHLRLSQGPAGSVIVGW